MPYIAIKSVPKDDETKKKVVDEINEVFLKYWGCPPQAMTISVEDISPEDWTEIVVKPQIEPIMDKVMILNGEKKY